ncbi:hypothetical protein [Modestobacter versicolor]|uniref:DNA-directed RNA polymerase specialized sigma24 family protein n=1 Tax=Modestobacter versicolor TaxID=429133 RepID=A0A323V514_9ACTN|nr:hypothetical protein [Modestobacter versicolor]MBB3674918.1 DNA-directed RNA polymerase specialized sigma24 family protein [Modestobacter versicolor]PZA19947.1 hypothetical protein DMO24_17980 [Modestobacter versicolor]
MDRADGFPAFVAVAEPELLGTAFLLTGSRRDAEALVLTALAQVHRRWRRLGSVQAATEEARRSLVAAALQPGAPQQVEDAGGPGPSPVDHRWLQALHRLAPRTRAAAVLQLHDGLDATATADLLGCDPATAVADLQTALHTLEPLLPAAEPPPVAAPAPAVDPPDDPADDDPYAIYRRPR